MPKISITIDSEKQPQLLANTLNADKLAGALGQIVSYLSACSKYGERLNATIVLHEAESILLAYDLEDYGDLIDHAVVEDGEL